LLLPGRGMRAFGCLLDRHRFGLGLYCDLMVGGDVALARRVLAEAVLTAWRERGFVGPETNARMWLYQLASHNNAAIDIPWARR
jgi:DNA-directed RNA polymerase specialized sigma24 family protein